MRTTIALVVFAAMAALSYITQWDLVVLHWVREHQAAQIPLWSWLTQFGNLIAQSTICFSLGAFFFWRKNKPALFTTLSVWLTLVFTEAAVQVVKVFFGRPRPYLFPDQYQFQWFEFAYDLRAFPSGHTATAVALAFMLSQLFPRYRLLFIFMGASVAMTRLMLERHWLADVLLSMGVGIVFAYWVFPILSTALSKYLSNDKLSLKPSQRS